jgi:hypothetical protein
VKTSKSLTISVLLVVSILLGWGNAQGQADAIGQHADARRETDYYQAKDNLARIIEEMEKFTEKPLQVETTTGKQEKGHVQVERIKNIVASSTPKPDRETNGQNEFTSFADIRRHLLMQGIKVESEMGEWEHELESSSMPLVFLKFVDAESGRVVESNDAWRVNIWPKDKVRSTRTDWDMMDSGFMKNPGEMELCFAIKPGWVQVGSKSFMELMRPGASYEVYRGYAEQEGSFYSVITIPEDVKPSEWLTYKIPVGVGIHPSERDKYVPQTQLKVRQDENLKPPLKDKGWTAYYYPQNIEEQVVYKKITPGESFSLENLSLGGTLTISSNQVDYTWIYVKKVDKYQMELPQDANFILKSTDQLRSIQVDLPKELYADNRDPKRLVIKLDNTNADIVDVLTTRQVRPANDHESYSEVPLDHASLKWLPGKWTINIKGWKKRHPSEEELMKMSLEERAKLPRKHSVLATGTITIPENAAPGTVVEIENLKLVDISDKFE